MNGLLNQRQQRIYSEKEKKSAISVWEVRFSQHEASPPLLVIPLVPQRERGQQADSTGLRTESRASVRRGSPLLTPHTQSHVQFRYQSAGGLRSEAGSGGRAPTGPRGAGPPERTPLPPSIGHILPKVSAGLTAVAEGHGLSGGRTLLPKTSYPSLPRGGHPQTLLHSRT